MSSEEDAFDDVSGTLGLTGAADTIIVLKRHSGMVKVFVRGRDIEEAEFAAEFNRNTCRWRLVGDAAEVFRSQERQAIIAALKGAGKDEGGNLKPMSISEIMAATERRDRNSVDRMLSRMRRAGEVVPKGRGLYTLPDTDPLKTGQIGQKGALEVGPGADGVGNVDDFPDAGSDRRSDRDLTGTESGQIAGQIAEAANPLAEQVNGDQSDHLTDLTGIYEGGRPVNGAEHNEPAATDPDDDPRDWGPLPASLDRRPICAFCKEPEPPPNQVAIDGLDVWLHRKCETKYLASLADDSSRTSPQPAPAEPSAATNGASAQRRGKRHTHEAIMVHVANVIEEQLNNRDARVAAAKEAQATSETPEMPETPAATEKQPDAVANVPDQAEKTLADVISTPDFGPRPTLPGDLRRWLQRKQNWETSKRADAEMKGRLH
jgi:hypothetical protein